MYVYLNFDWTNSNFFSTLEKTGVSLNDKPYITFWCKGCVTFLAPPSFHFVSVLFAGLIKPLLRHLACILEMG